MISLKAPYTIEEYINLLVKYESIITCLDVVLISQKMF